MWKVIGGEATRGIVVRKEQNLNSEKLPERLSHGAVISEAEVVNGRLRYNHLIFGDGPEFGWISVAVSGKELITKVGENSESYGINDAPKGSEYDSTPEDGKQQANDLLNMYAKHFGKSGDEFTLGQNRKVFAWNATSLPYSGHQHEQILSEMGKGLEATGSKVQNPTVVLGKDLVVGTDGETLKLCSHCRLPMGELTYKSPDGVIMHAECMAQNVLLKLQNEVNERLCKAEAVKQKHREEYDIGWRVTRIPHNVDLAPKLKCSSMPAGMSCLLWDYDTNSVKLAATLEPAAAINLEYLSIALQVRKRTGREPFFSLERVNGETDSMQKKVFDPEWLQGTSLGEVMFQADYHLKELSMGEYDQPVVGMKNCFDLTADDPKQKDKEWNAREWFVVNKCEVQLSEDDVLIPYVKMAVQAREQKVNTQSNKMQDIPVTSRSHPLVKYAEQFTHNFDLIAERKSVINQLREVAKATVVAKFLIDSKVRLENEWFCLNEEVKPNSCVTEIPQLWNMRGASQIQVKDGEIVDAHKGFTASCHSIYGGVEFGVDKFRLATPITARAAPAVAVAAPQARAGMQTISTSIGRPQGVDLNLRKFDLSAPTRSVGQMRSCSASLDSVEAKVSIGCTFLQELKNGFAESSFEENHKALLQKIFNPILCDRHDEGGVFVPPDTRAEHVSKLAQLVKQESDALSRRIDKFTSRDFKMEAPGRDFPPSWTSAYELSRSAGEGPLTSDVGSLQPGQLEPRPDYRAQAWVFEQFLLKTATPLFDRMTEEGARFRIYRIGSIEVRTVQEHSGEEKVVTVMSIHLSSNAKSIKKEAVKDDEKLVKVTHFVERVPINPLHRDDTLMPEHHFYVVAETAAGNLIVTEKLDQNAATIQENPRDMQDRNSLAKTVCSVDCSRANTSVLDLKNFSNNSLSWSSTSKKYCECVVDMIAGRDSWQKPNKLTAEKMHPYLMQRT